MNSLPAEAWADYGKQPADWERYVTAVMRRKWFVAAVVLLGTLGGVLATRLFASEYAVRTVLWVERDDAPREPGALTGRAIVGPEGWVDLVRSQTVLEPVVRDLRLYVRPATPDAAHALRDFRLEQTDRPGAYQLAVSDAGEYVLTREGGQVVDEGMIGDSIGSALGFRWAPVRGDLPPDGRVAFAVSNPYEAALGLGRSLEVTLDPSGGFVRIRLEGENKARITATVNAVADRVVSVAADLKREKLETLTTILAERRTEAQQALRESETTLSAFRVRAVDDAAAGGPPMGPEGTTVTAAATERALDWRLELDELRRERRTIERFLETPRDRAIRIDALASIGSVQSSPPLQLALDELTQHHAEMRALRKRYREASAPVQQLQSAIDRLQDQTIPALAEQLVAELRDREMDLAPRVDSAFGQLRRLPPRSLEQGRLEREVAAAERTYGNVRERFERAQLELASAVPDVQVLDHAVEPQGPERGFAALVVALAFLTSLGLAIVAATIWDHRDPTVRYPEQVTRGLQMGIVGAVPHVDMRRVQRGTASELEIIESLRALRHRLLQARGPDGALTLTVTSPGIADGKSFVSLNLALSFAYAGYRTLLIDGDVRRGVQHRTLGLPLQPGLTDVLRGRPVVERAIRETHYDNLSLLASGTRMHRAPELLESRELHDLLVTLRLTYAVIIVDSPPLQAGIDPLVLTTATVNGLLVLRAGASEIPATLSKLAAMTPLPVRMIGAVLNDVRSSSAFREYTYDLRGYELPDEDRPQLVGGRR